MNEKEKEAIEEIKKWRNYIIKNREKVNRANDIEFYLTTILNLIEKQNKELEIEGNLIDEMAEHIVSSAIVDDTVCAIKCDCETDPLEDCTHEKMLNCTKEYFRKKVEK